MPFAFRPRFLFPFKEEKNETANRKSFPLRYLSRTDSISVCDDGELDIKTHMFDKLEYMNKPTTEDQKEKVAVTIGSSVRRTCDNDQSAEDSIKKFSSEISEEKIRSEVCNHISNAYGISSVKIMKTNTDYKKQVCSCSTKKYSDCETQTDDEISIIHDPYQEYLPKKEKKCFKKSLLTHLIQKFFNKQTCFKNSNQRSSIFFNKKSDKEIVNIGDISEIRSERPDLCEFTNFYSEKNSSVKGNIDQASKSISNSDSNVKNRDSGLHGSSHGSTPARPKKNILEKLENESDDILHISTSNNIYSLKTKSEHHSKSKSGALSIQTNYKPYNGATKYNSTFLYSSCTRPRYSLASLNVEEDLCMFNTFESRKDKLCERHPNNTMLTDQQQLKRGNNFIHTKEHLRQNYVNRLKNEDNIFLFKSSDEFLDQVDTSSSDSEVYIRPRRKERLDNGMQVTPLTRGLNFPSNLSQNCYQNEYPHQDPPPSPENSSPKCYQKFENSVEANVPFLDIHDRPWQENSEIDSFKFREGNHNTSLDYEFQYQTKVSRKKHPDFESAHYYVTNSQCNIVRSDSKGSSGYDSMDRGSESFPKRFLRNNFQNKSFHLGTRSDKLQFSNRSVQPELKNEFTLPETNLRRTYSQLRSINDIPITSTDLHAYSSSERKQFSEHSYQRNRTFSDEMYPPIKNDVRYSIKEFAKSPCRKTFTDKRIYSNSYGMASMNASEEYLHNGKILPQWQITNKSFSMTNSPSTQSIENPEIQKAVSVEKLYELKRANMFHKHFGDSADDDVENYEFPLKVHEISNLNMNGKFHCYCRQQRRSFRKKSRISNRDPSDNIIFKFYGFIDGPLASTS